MAFIIRTGAIGMPRPLVRFAGLVQALLYCSGLLTGCTVVGPDFKRPNADVSDHWLDAEDTRLRASPADYREWWKGFHDPVLEELIQTAYRQNLSLHAAGVRIFEARAQLGIAVGNLFPQSQQVQGSENYNRASERSPSAPQTRQSGAVGFDYSQVQAGFSANWELDFWGKLRRSVESADASLISAIAAYDNALVTLTGDVAKTYVQIRTLEERLRIARENMEIQRESLRIAETRFKGGATSERDVQQALTQLNGTE
ncbi:MAG: TolC family protein, partial [Deltaproteobacteria bacterium]|nr:TolC family protein [Deltaproteobacteria bacterium]